MLDPEIQPDGFNDLNYWKQYAALAVMQAKAAELKITELEAENDELRKRLFHSQKGLRECLQNFQ